MSGDFRTARDAAAANARRWLEELHASPARNTLSFGMIQQAGGHAEDLLRRSAKAYMDRNPKLAAQAMEAAAGGHKPVEKLTLGQCLKVLGFMDARRELFSGRRLISKADQAVLDDVSRLRNDFAHGRVDATDLVKVRRLLSGVRALCDMTVVVTAMSLDSE